MSNEKEITIQELILNILQQVEITTSNSGNLCIKDIDEVVDDIYNTFENNKQHD